MGFFDETGQTAADSQQATTAGVQAVAAALLLVVGPSVWFQVMAPGGSVIPTFTTVMLLCGAIVPGILALLSWRRRHAAPLWIRAVGGGALLVAGILVALAVLGLILATVAPNLGLS
ncbi:hypothetical protein [Tenggerimyces flavus]|uniref:Uncharacterized protein n=1 Tax=Tenggerimyces flavus TaxID=1708749 RepID=A0ABV7YI93_9ACTN|nr:hypothetical protein [Tenggerimyces flavus]MBM7787663.1 hypothetical protein [Tenggerimyces flavus]